MSARRSAKARIQAAAVRLFVETGRSSVSVSDLAEAAGVARGTIYNNLSHPEHIYQEIVADLVREMHGHVSELTAGVSDPAIRVSFGVRAFIRRAHSEPSWASFMTRFALNDRALRNTMHEPPAQDISDGLASGRFVLSPTQSISALALIGASVLASMMLVLEGEASWKDAAANGSELILRALGLTPEEAAEISSIPLPMGSEGHKPAARL